MGEAVQVEARGTGPVVVPYKSGDTESGDIDLEGFELVGLVTDAAFQGTTITFKAAPNKAGGGNQPLGSGVYQEVRDQSGAVITVTLAASRVTVLSTTTMFRFLRYLHLVYGSSQNANGTVQLLRKQGA